jgi:hypothetical protein
MFPEAHYLRVQSQARLGFVVIGLDCPHIGLPQPTVNF